MSDSSALMKVVLTLGVIMLFINLVYPGANAGWTGLVNTLSTGPSLPTFNNPLAQATYNQVVSPAQDVVQPDSWTGCSDYVDCLADKNDTTSNVTGNSYVNWTDDAGAPQELSFRLSTYPTGGVAVTRAQVTIWVRSLTDTPRFSISTYAPYNDSIIVADVSPDIGTFPLPTYFQPITRYFQFLGGCSTGPCPASIFSGALMKFYPTSSSVGGDVVQIAYVSVTLEISGGSEPCTTSFLGLPDVGCIISQFFGGLFLWIQTGFNFLIYVVQSFLAILGFIFSLITGVFFGLLTATIFLLALPGAPLIVQLIVDALVIPELILVFYIAGTFVIGALGGVVNKA